MHGGLPDVDEADPVATASEIGTDGNGRRAARPRQGAGDAARVPEVIAHHALDALLRQRAGVAEQVRRSVLHRMGQHVVMTLRVQVQDGADAQQEILGVVEPRRILGPLPQQCGIGQCGDGARRVDVAQRARRVLHVGLELIQRGVEAGVPLVHERDERVNHPRVGSRRVEGGREPLEERAAAVDGPRVDEGEQKLGIVGLQALEVFDIAHLMAHHEPEIPEWMQQTADEPFFGVADPTAEQQQQVDVGVEAQLAAAVATHGHDADRLLRRRRRRKKLPQQDVEPLGVTLERRTAGLPASGLIAQLAPRRREDRRRRRPRWRQGLTVPGGRTLVIGACS